MKSGNCILTGNEYINYVFVVLDKPKQLTDGSDRLTVTLDRCIITKHMDFKLESASFWYTNYTYRQKDIEIVKGNLKDLRSKISIYLNMSLVC